MVRFLSVARLGISLGATVPHKIVGLNAPVGFTARADEPLSTGHRRVLAWLGGVAPSKPRVVLTHGEDNTRRMPSLEVKKHYGLTISMPRLGEAVEL